MIIAQQKRKENIVEYVLYMWQVEDLIRACGLDAGVVRRAVVDRYEQPDEVKQAIVGWYNDLTDRMRAEGVTENGHISELNAIVHELNDLHLRLLKDPHETAYGALYYRALPHIVQLRAKSDRADASEIETCLTAVYGYLLLRLGHRNVSAETLEAVKQISGLLNFLAGKYGI